MGNAIDWLKEQTVLGDMDKWVNEQTVIGDMTTWMDDQGMEWLQWAVPAVAATIFAPGLIPSMLASAGGFLGKVPLIGKTLAAPFELAARGVGALEGALGLGEAAAIEAAAAAPTAGITGLEAAALPELGAPGEALAVGGDIFAEAAKLAFEEEVLPKATGFWASTLGQATISGLGAGVGAMIPNIMSLYAQAAIADRFRDRDTTITRTTQTTFPDRPLPTLSLPGYTAPTGRAAPSLGAAPTGGAAPRQRTQAAPPRIKTQAEIAMRVLPSALKMAATKQDRDEILRRGLALIEGLQGNERGFA